MQSEHIEHSSKIQILVRFLDEKEPQFFKTLCVLAWHSGFVPQNQTESVAQELLSEVTIQALEHANQFDPSRDPGGWLAGIAKNLLKRRFSQTIRLSSHESSSDCQSEAEFFTRFAGVAVAGPEVEVVFREQLTLSLSRLSDQDRHLLQLALAHGLNGEELATELNLKPGTARVRLHRALQRLKDAWISIDDEAIREEN